MVYLSVILTEICHLVVWLAKFVRVFVLKASVGKMVGTLCESLVPLILCLISMHFAFILRTSRHNF